jgi:hypothetical protein
MAASIAVMWIRAVGPLAAHSTVTALNLTWLFVKSRKRAQSIMDKLMCIALRSDTIKARLPLTHSLSLTACRQIITSPSDGTHSGAVVQVRAGRSCTLVGRWSQQQQTEVRHYLPFLLINLACSITQGNTT